MSDFSGDPLFIESGMSPSASSIPSAELVTAHRILSLQMQMTKQVGHKEFQAELFQVLKLEKYVKQSYDGHNWAIWEWS